MHILNIYQKNSKVVHAFLLLLHVLFYLSLLLIVDYLVHKVPNFFLAVTVEIL